jgi:hypothetical protein
MASTVDDAQDVRPIAQSRDTVRFNHGRGDGMASANGNADAAFMDAVRREPDPTCTAGEVNFATKTELLIAPLPVGKYFLFARGALCNQAFEKAQSRWLESVVCPHQCFGSRVK